MTLHRFNGDEIYSVESATIQYYKDEDGLFAVTFRANAGTVALQTLPDTASMRKKPFAEVTLHIPKLPALAFRVGSTFTVPKGFDDSTREQHTDFYYCEHGTIDENEITIVERDGLRVRARITGTTTDVNYYDGSKPRTKVVVEADFTLSI